MAEPMLRAYAPMRIMKIEAMDRTATGLPEGMPTPLERGRACGDGSLVAIWTAPGSILALALDDAGMAALARIEAACADDDGPWAAFDVSHGYAALELSGPGVLDILASGTALDLSSPPSSSLSPEGRAATVEGFPVGAAHMTGIAHVPTLLWRSAGDTVRILVARSYGDWMTAWLLDAGRPFGLSSRPEASP
ncbi:MAG TPA: sarcosine oxidase subunit gamma family protein [Alphaproteobacteria bacterium]|nr:sarcosine oxidase subunit gamma family protein [Alphaproteobacteria bacterium]